MQNDNPLQDANNEQHQNINHNQSSAENTTAKQTTQGTTGQPWEEMTGERKNNDRDPEAGHQQDITTDNTNTPENESFSSKSGIGEAGEKGEPWKEMQSERKNNDRDPG